MKQIFALTAILFLCLVPANMNAQTDSITPLQSYDRHWEMQPGLFRVMKNGVTGVVKASGEVIVPCRFDQVWNPNNNDYIRVLLNSKTGLYHLKKGLILPPEYDQIWNFEEGLAKVMRKRRFGLINTDGLMVIPCEYTHIWPRKNNRFKVLRDGLMGYLAPDGATIVPVIYQQIWDYQNNLARVLRDGKMGFIDESGNEKIPAIYQHAGEFENNQARVLLDGQQATIDTQGHILSMDANKKNTIAPPSKGEEPGTDILITQEDPAPRIKIKRDYIEIKHAESPKPPKRPNSRRKYYRAHLKGIGLASNGYLNNENKKDLPSGYEFMDPVHSKSLELSLYPVQESVALLGDWFGLTFGLGLQYNNYRLDLDTPNDIPETAKEWFPETSVDASISKSKIMTLFLNAPLLAELQIKNRYNRAPLYLAGGVVGGVKLQSHTKLVYHDSEGSHKKKKRDHLNIPDLRYGFMAKAGYDEFSVYATYYPKGLFDTNKGPEIYPYSIGIMFNFD